jgi:hypothetical protein
MLRLEYLKLTGSTYSVCHLDAQVHGIQYFQTRTPGFFFGGGGVGEQAGGSWGRRKAEDATRKKGRVKGGQSWQHKFTFSYH